MSADAIPSVFLPRFRFSGLAAFLGGVAFLSGAIHILAILLVPALAERDGWSRLVAVAGQGNFAELRVAGPQAADVAGLDPLFVTGACHLYLGEVPVGLAVETRDRFWSLALYDPTGTIVFSLNDRTAIDGRLDMLVVDAAQNAALRHSPPADIEQTIVVETASQELLALLRLFAPTTKTREEAREILQAAECLPAPLAGPL